MKFTLITNNIDLYEKVKNKKDLDIIFDEKYTYGDVVDIVKKKYQRDSDALGISKEFFIRKVVLKKLHFSILTGFMISNFDVISPLLYA